MLNQAEAFVTDHPAHDHPRRSDVRNWVRLKTQETVIDSIAEMRGKYRVVYADPPWQYNDSGASTEGSYGKAEDHYPTMPIEDICKIPVAAHVRPNAVLFLWTTAPLLLQNPGPREVIEAWGFDAKTGIVWDKDAHVVGHYVDHGAHAPE